MPELMVVHSLVVADCSPQQYWQKVQCSWSVLERRLLLVQLVSRLAAAGQSARERLLTAELADARDPVGSGR